MKRADSESSSDSIEDQNKSTNRFIHEDLDRHGPKNGQFSPIKPFNTRKPRGIGDDDIDPFTINSEMGTSIRPIKGMHTTPEDIYDIHRQHKKKSDEDSSKSEGELPRANYDPINPFNKGNDPDPDHFQPPK